MTTPMKALIQERLRAKMVCRRPDFGLNDDYERDTLRQPTEVTSYDITSRGDNEDATRSTGSRGPTSRRNSATQACYPIRLHTHIDPSAYLVPSEHDGRYYPPSTSFGSGSASNDDRHRNPRYPREQHRDTSVYDLPPRREQHQRDQRRRHTHHHLSRVQQQQPHLDSPSRGGYASKHSNPSRASGSPWHRPEPIPTHSPTPRGHPKQDVEHYANNDNVRHRRESKSVQPSPRFTASGSSSHHYSGKDRIHENSNQSPYKVRELSPTRHHEPPTSDKPARYSPVQRSHSNRTESKNARSNPNAVTPTSHKPQPRKKETIQPDTTKITHEAGRQSPPQLDMGMVEPPTKLTVQKRAWSDIMSPESRLAAKAFVEKRQRRTAKGTPRTMATQRWLEVIDARASRCEAAKQVS